MRVSAVIANDATGASERLMLTAVYKAGPYPPDGSDEDNTFSKFTPSAVLDMQVANPELVGTFAVGDTFYVDFTMVG